MSTILHVQIPRRRLLLLLFVLQLTAVVVPPFSSSAVAVVLVVAANTTGTSTSTDITDSNSTNGTNSTSTTTPTNDELHEDPQEEQEQQEEEEIQEEDATEAVLNSLAQGCLYSHGLHPYVRVCNSDDPPEAIEQGLCRPSEFQYLEIRIKCQVQEIILVFCRVCSVLVVYLGNTSLFGRRERKRANWITIM